MGSFFAGLAGEGAAAAGVVGTMGLVLWVTPRLLPLVLVVVVVRLAAAVVPGGTLQPLLLAVGDHG